MWLLSNINIDDNNSSGSNNNSNSNNNNNPQAQQLQQGINLLREEDVDFADNHLMNIERLQNNQNNQHQNHQQGNDRHRMNHNERYAEAIAADVAADIVAREGGGGGGDEAGAFPRPFPPAAAAAYHRQNNNYQQNNQNLRGNNVASLLIRQQQMQVNGPADPRRMEINEEERNRALELKAAIAADPELDMISDFKCVQYALVDNGDIPASLERARHMQSFREEYGILDTFEDGRQYLLGLTTLLPEVYLSYSFNSRDSNYVIVLDLGKWDMDDLRTPEKMAEWMRGAYYLFQVLNPEFAAIRNGVVLLYECEGYEWKRNFDMNIFRKIWTELAAPYPQGFHQIKHFHTGIFFNLIVSMTKRFLPTSVRNKFQMGCQFDGRLDTVYMVPNVQAANQRIHARFEDSLQRRYHYEKTFSLDTCVPKHRPSGSNNARTVVDPMELLRAGGVLNGNGGDDMEGEGAEPEPAVP